MYSLFTIYFTLGLHRLKLFKMKSSLPTISIIVAVRNEESNLQLLLKSLVEQDYPKEKMEIVVVNDRSTDNSCLLYTSPSPRDRTRSRMPSSA